MKRITMKFMALALLMLAGVAASHAQVPFTTTTVQRPMRQDGLAEAAGEVTLVPLNTGNIIAGSSIDFTFSVPIATPAANISFANNVTCVANANCTAAQVTASLNGTNTVRLTWTGQSDFVIAAANRITIRGIRVNANAAVGVGTVSVSMSATSPNTVTNPITFTTSTGLVGVLNSTIDATFTAGTLLQTCAIPNANGGGSFTTGLITVTEKYGDALLTDVQENALAGAPASVVGTQVRITLNGVPAGVRVLAPAASVINTSVPSPVGTTLALTLTSGNATVDQTTAGTPIEYVYRTTASTNGLVEIVDLSFRFGTNNTASTSSTSSIPTIGGTGSAITATVSVTPISVTTTEVPRFVANGIGPTLVQNVTDCNTRLLFTWVATVADVETGVAIANTSSDDAAFGSGSSNGATSQNGTCTLTGYPSAGGTPVSFTTASISAGQTLAFVMSNTTGFSNFTGYVLTVCNFQAAHAFAFITNGRGTVAGPTLAQGYLANVIPGGRRPPSGSTFESLGD